MKLLALIILSGSMIFLVSACAPKEEMPRIIPMEDFFKNAEKTGFTLSPDGDYLAYLQPWESRMNIHVQKIGEEEVTRITDATERDISGFFWASNSRIAYVQDKGGDENFRLYAVNADGSDWADLTPFEKVQVDLIDDLRDNDDEVIIQLNNRDPRLFDAYRINVVTGDMTLLAENPGNIVG
jgi:Tol biopolymer transport system component